jgi:hypothetical protein
MKHYLRLLVVLAAIGLVVGVAVLRSSGGAHSARPTPDSLYKGNLSTRAAAALATQSPRTPDSVKRTENIVNKGSATLGAGNTTATWAGDNVTANTADQTDNSCNSTDMPPLGPGRCDEYSISVANTTGTGKIAFSVTVGTEDYDLYIYDKDNNEVTHSGNQPGIDESATVLCPTADRGPYRVRVIYFTTLNDPLNNVYHATATWSAFSCPQPTHPTYVDNALTFAPSTLVSAHWIAGEPQLTMERTNAPWSDASKTSDNRMFIDWPLSSRSNIGMLNRSTDGGNSFRLLFDLNCASRDRPNCATGGGGDTENDVNLKTGTVFFGDQESLANEASASSLDHGDSFLLQTPLASTGSATDREWIAATDDSQKVGGVGPNIEAFYTYHIPPNAFIHAIPDTTHVPLPQAGPQIENAGQTGQPRVDNNPTSPGYGWIYYPFREYVLPTFPSGTAVATAPSSSYQLATSWHPSLVTPDGANSFPWIAIDSAGNAYMSWDPAGVVYYAYSLINDPVNNPKLGGVPGSLWSQPIRVTPPGVTSAVFPEITAGAEPGRLGVTYVGSTNAAGDPNASGPSALWKTYAAVITGANTDTPTIYTGAVSHRYVHHGNICTHGTTCGLPGVGKGTDDRSFLDMIDVSFDHDGRLGIVHEDNNTAHYQDDVTTNPGQSDMVDLEPFIYFTKQTTGPTLYAGSPANVSIPRDARDDPAGDATWPNTAAGANLPGLDILHASIGLVGSNLVAHIKLADASTAAMQAAITGYNAATCAPPCQAQRLQYVMRFNTDSDAYHMDLEVLPDGTTMRAFGGRLDANDYVVNPASPTADVGTAYRSGDAGYTVTKTITPGPNGEIVLSAPASQFDGLQSGDNLFSVTAFAMAGPTENLDATAAYVERTVDASPPFDTTLGNGPTAVGFGSFAAHRTGAKVVLGWRMASQAQTAGFNVYRTNGRHRVRLNSRLIPVAGGAGSHAYSRVDRHPGRNPRYTLEELRLDGSSVLHGPVAAR